MIKKVLCGIILFILLCGVSSATTYTVCSSGCDYTTIQAAENAAGAGDIVYVYNGTYSENIVVDTAHLTIQGEGRDVTKVISTSHIFNVDAAYVNITGFNITGSVSSNAGVHVQGVNYDYCNISYNRIMDCYDGIMFRDSGNEHQLVLENEIKDCSDVGMYLRDSGYSNITGNSFDGNNFCVYVQDSNNCYVNSNYINNSNNGIYTSGTLTSIVFYNNYVYGNTNNVTGGSGGSGVSWGISKKSGTNIFGGNYLSGNYWGDYLGVDNDGDGLGNTLLPYNAGGNIGTGGDSNPLCVAAGGPTGNRNCEYGDICVNTTAWWRDDSPVNSTADPITPAIAEAGHGETVYIFNGTYSDNIDLSAETHISIVGEDRDTVIINPDNTAVEIFHIQNGANYFNISDVTLTGATTSWGIYLQQVHHCNVSNVNSSFNSMGVVGQYGNYHVVEYCIIHNNTARGISFPYYANYSIFRHNEIEYSGGRGLDLCTSGNYVRFLNNSVMGTYDAGTETHVNGCDIHASDNVIHESTRSWDNYGSRDYLIRVGSNNLTLLNLGNPVGESFDFDVENNDCDWRIKNTDGQLFTENSGATAYAYPSNFSMYRASAIETFSVTLVPMTLLTTDDQVSVTGISYNNVAGSENYNITADCTDTGETVTYTASVANSTHYYGCYVDGSLDHTVQAVAGVVTWTYSDGFSASHDLAILWNSVVGGNDISLGANKYGLIKKIVSSSQNLSVITTEFDHDICFTWWNSTTDKWESYYSGDSYNSAKIIPQNDSYFVLMDGTGEIIVCSLASAGTVVIPIGWSTTYLRESTAKTLTAIKSDMGVNCNQLYTWNHTADNTGSWTNTGTFSVLPNQGLLINSTAQFSWDGTVS